MEGTIPRYSQLYVERKTGLQDSTRLRKRIASYYKTNIHYESFSIGRYDSKQKRYDEIIAHLIETELGLEVPASPTTYGTIFYTYDLLENCELHDFLDMISIISFALKQRESKRHSKWRDFVERVFREEKSIYSIDSNDVIHPYIDEDFSSNHQSTLNFLSIDRYEQVKTIYENAFSCLRSDKQDTRTAIKDMFEAIETLAKLLVPRIKTLSSNVVNNEIQKKCLSNIEDSYEQDYIKQMMSSLANWVNAHHIYRHGQKKEKYIPPSLETAVLSLSTGSSFLRYLLEVDQKLNKL